MRVVAEPVLGVAQCINHYRYRTLHMSLGVAVEAKNVFVSSS